MTHEMKNVPKPVTRAQKAVIFDTLGVRLEGLMFTRLLGPKTIL